MISHCCNTNGLEFIHQLKLEYLDSYQFPSLAAMIRMLLYGDFIIGHCSQNRIPICGSAQLWKADATVSFIGCAEQYQFCNQSACTKFAAIGPFLGPDAIKSLRYNSDQLATYDLLVKILTVSQINPIIFALQQNILLAKDHLFGSYRLSTSMPSNQWQLEVQSVFNLSLASIQLLMTEHASPTNVPISVNETVDDRVFKETSPEALRVCQNQKVRTTSFYSFSVLELFFILFGGSLLILLGIFIPIFVSWSQKRSSIEAIRFKRAQWIWDDVLFLLQVGLTEVVTWRTDTRLPVPMEPSRLFKLPWLYDSLEWSRSSTNMQASADNGLLKQYASQGMMVEIE
jgi:hypothetical protein